MVSTEIEKPADQIPIKMNRIVPFIGNAIYAAAFGLLVAIPGGVFLTILFAMAEAIKVAGQLLNGNPHAPATALSTIGEFGSRIIPQFGIWSAAACFLVLTVRLFRELHEDQSSRQRRRRWRRIPHSPNRDGNVWSVDEGNVQGKEDWHTEW